MKRLIILSFIICSLPSIAQIKVSGIVMEKTESGNLPLPGVTITVVGSSRGGVLSGGDNGGDYTIEAKPEDKLSLSFIGFENQIVEINGRTKIDILMVNKSEELDAVTVVASENRRKNR